MQKQNHLEVSGDYPENQQLQNRPYRAADMILNYLEQLGVEYMFGIPGGGIEPLSGHERRWCVVRGRRLSVLVLWN